jgi:hypothetical protein
MKTISVAVSESDYEAFRRAARAQHRPIAQLIREALATYREEKLEAKTPLVKLPILESHHLISRLPSRAEIYEEIFSEQEPTSL